jgi:hypothetical protein
MDSVEDYVRAQYRLSPGESIPTEAFRRALAYAVAEERERCAKIAEEFDVRASFEAGARTLRQAIADAIREGR